MKMQTWMVWNTMTGKLELVLEHVPEAIKSDDIRSILPAFGYWPVDILAQGPGSVANRFIKVEWAGYVPLAIRNQAYDAVKGSVHTIDWPTMWIEASDQAKQLETNLQQMEALVAMAERGLGTGRFQTDQSKANTRTTG